MKKGSVNKIHRLFQEIGKNVQNGKTEQNQSYARFWVPESVYRYAER